MEQMMTQKEARDNTYFNIIYSQLLEINESLRNNLKETERKRKANKEVSV